MHDGRGEPANHSENHLLRDAPDDAGGERRDCGGLLAVPAPVRRWVRPRGPGVRVPVAQAHWRVQEDQEEEAERDNSRG